MKEGLHIPDLRVLATKTAEQLDLQALHRVRERLVGHRTGVVNQIRAFLLERGVAVRQGLRFPRTDVLSPRMMRIIGSNRLMCACAAQKPSVHPNKKRGIS